VWRAFGQVNAGVIVPVVIHEICADFQNQRNQRCKGVFDVCLLKSGGSHCYAPFTVAMQPNYCTAPKIIGIWYAMT
jgi:hypothetical protein